MSKARALPLLVALLSAGCTERVTLFPVTPCTTTVVGTVSTGLLIDKVDLLLVIDNSSSMIEEQGSIVAALPHIVAALTTGDRDGDGVQDFTRVRSLHLGIIDSDMGVGDVTGVVSCDPGLGDDGIMRTCAAQPAFLDFGPGGAADLHCLRGLGTDGCGFEAQLEAPLKAISLAPTATGESPVSWTQAGYRPPTFFGSTFGHGNDRATNGDFLRPDSVLVVVVVSDEDDCSTPDPHIFSPDDPTYADVPLGLRCHTFASELYPVERYAEGFLGLRADPAMLVYGAIVGIPPGLAGMASSVILADPRMTERVYPAGTDQLLPACVSPSGRGFGYPAVRMTELARELDGAGARTTLQSICSSEYASAFDAIVDEIAEALTPSCLGRQLVANGAGFVDCDVLEVLPSIASGVVNVHCAGLAHPEAFELDHVELTSNADGTTTSREACRVRQVGRAGAGRDAGWAYDDGNPALAPGWSELRGGCTGRVGFSIAGPERGAEVRLECTEHLLVSTHEPVSRGTPCRPASGETLHGPCALGHAVPHNPATLACDPFTLVCGVACIDDADCARAGLLTDVCDRRVASEYFVGTPLGIAPDERHTFCVSPTCAW